MQLNIFLNRVFRKLLQRIVGFDKWHISPLGERPYAMDIINHCNRLDPRDYFSEIGCGLGDITRNVRYAYRIGYDLDKKVLKAARLLPVKGKSKSVLFKEFTFPETALAEKVNALVMVNWIHHIEPTTLKIKIAEYFAKNILPQGQIIIDTVQDKAYRHNHDIVYLTEGLDCEVTRLGEYARSREVWTIKKLN